jgi:hypothetical protein
MRISTLCIIWTSLASALLLNACSHEWDGLEVLSSGSSSGDTSSASSSSGSSGGAGGGGGGGGASSSSSGSGGGANDCAPLMPSVAACGNLVETFEDATTFAANWALSTGSNSSVVVSNGHVTIHLDGKDVASFASTNPDFDLKGCGIWVEITKVATESAVMTRLSVGTPSMSSRYTIGHLNQNLEVHVNGTAVFSIPFIATEMHYVRIREEGGKIYFGYSVDGNCWTDMFDVPNSLTSVVEGRISVAHVPIGQGVSADGQFDNYCVPPP